MKSWINALARTREAIKNIAGIFTGNRPIDARTIETLEAALIQADVPPRMVADLVAELRRTNATTPPSERMIGIILASVPLRPAFTWNFAMRPWVLLVTGVNGSGKTTTAAKLAWQAKQAGLVPILAATDTFRAAGTEQLRIWADRVGCEVVAGNQGADAAAVAYDAVSAAVARKADVVVIDTAGRMHTKKHLMDELQKVRRSIAKACPGAPHASWIALDATLGNNAIVQAREFKSCIELDGAIVTKLDGSSKAGFILALEKELGLPIQFVGLGEGIDNLASFDVREFARGLLGEMDTPAGK